MDNRSFARCEKYFPRTLILASCLWCSTYVQAQLPGGVEVAKKPKFEALPGKAIGVLVWDAQQALAAEGRHGPQGAVMFSRDGASYRWIYVPAQGDEQGETVYAVVDSSGSQKMKFTGVDFACPENLRAYGISSPYALVEVTVNAGRGSPAGAESFVATDLRRLDGTAAYPLEVGKVIEGLKQSLQERFHDKEQLEPLMQQSQAAALGVRKPTGPRETRTDVFVTWLPAAERLRVEFVIHIFDGSYRYAGGIEPDPNVLSEELQRMRYGTQFGVVATAVYEISRDGATISSRETKPRAFKKELPPPESHGGTAPKSRPTPATPALDRAQ